MFDDVRRWNRDYIVNYVEVYVKVDNDTLMLRNQKQLYKSGAVNVVGASTKAQLPTNPHITINNFEGTEISHHVDRIICEWTR